MKGKGKNDASSVKQRRYKALEREKKVEQGLSGFARVPSSEVPQYS